MAETTHGTAWLYGIAETAPTNATILSIGLKKSDRTVDETPAHSGRVAHIRADDQLDELEMELRILGTYSKPAISSKMTIAGGTFAGDYMVTSTDEGKQAKGHVTFKVSARKDEYVTYT